MSTEEGLPARVVQTLRHNLATPSGPRRPRLDLVVQIGDEPVMFQVLKESVTHGVLSPDAAFHRFGATHPPQADAEIVTVPQAFIARLSAV